MRPSALAPGKGTSCPAMTPLRFCRGKMGVAPATAAPAPRESAGRFTPVFRGKEIFTNHSPSRTKRKSVIAGSGMRSITLHCVREERICKICGACGKYTGRTAAEPPVGVALPPRGRGGGGGWGHSHFAPTKAE